MLGFLSLWNGQTHIPFLFTRIPYRSAACLVVTDCFTASNTFITSSFREQKAPDIFQSKTADALKFHILFFLLRGFLLRLLFLLHLHILQPLRDGVLRLWSALDLCLFR